MTKRKTNPDYLNGVPELLVLELLSRRPMYGYELVQAIKDESGGTLEFGEGCVYPILHRLEAEKLLTSREQAAGGRTRIVYETTARGRARLAESISTWQRISEAINHALEGGEERERASILRLRPQQPGGHQSNF